MLQVDIALENGLVLTMDQNKTVLTNGTVLIKDDRILAISEAGSLAGTYETRKTVDAKHKLLMPGLINAHTHSPMTLFRGIADDIALEKWLHDHIFPLEQKHINKETVGLGTQLAIIEMLESGTTTFADMYYFMDEVATEAKKAGIRAVVCEGLLDYPTPNQKTPAEGLAYTESLLQKYQNDPLIKVGVGPHAPYTASANLLQKAKDLANKYNAPYHIHLSETKTEVDRFVRQYDLTPVQYLISLGVLDKNTVAAHCVHLRDNDGELLLHKQVGIVHNPACNMKLASGAAPISKLSSLGCKLALGTDGAASNNNLNILEEMHMAALMHKLINNDPTVLSAQKVVEMATIGAAEVLGMDNSIGSLEAGKKADLLVINLSAAHLLPLYNIYSQIVYSMKSSDIQTVIIDGKVVLENRFVHTLNTERVYAKIREFGEKLKN